MQTRKLWKKLQNSPYSYIIKPYRDDELKTTIEMALHKHQRNQEEMESEVGLLTTKLEELKIGRIGLKKINSTYYLSTILCNGFLMIGYMVFILYFVKIQFSLTAPITILLLSISLFPSRNIRSVEGFKKY